ncbi:fungal-specific transcription factor domain-containing protein [Boletus edulis BED1]|uniref:Fungal-specific transcription factor domain-containing protein n=1 Tax=Boletus edulis BED1 TaxID=1328754 RepID=A0AAD4GI96_BOLED|nr:fungal-specific transcription factor domain-containing protein [Boletus edulis BED1]
MSTARWNESERSEEESNQDSFSSRKRSSRACDHCRKTKSKCEPSNTPGTCKGCALGGNVGTIGPSYKRGPPKGYIQAIEQRWHQVESLLGSLLACPDSRVQSLLADIRQDELAGEILNRVETGPFGPSGRLSQPASATKEDIFACIFRSNQSSRDAARSRRQSRISREIVSSSRDNALSSMPTAEWQDRLAARLSSTRQSPSRISTEAPLPQRRRLDESSPGADTSHPNWNEMYIMEASSDSAETDEPQCATAFGQLSLDENQEVRYHGKTSGLHLLIRNDRVDSRLDGGVWRLPMARFWPSAKADMSALPPEADIPVTFPPFEMQDRLLGLYFSYAHPIFPVIHKARFLREYNDCGNLSPPDSKGDSPSPARESPQTISKLLLLSIFSVAARYLDERASESADKIWDDRCEYLTQAKSVLARVSHSCRASTCQALLLLGHREFGIGSMEQGWLYIGAAISALDLGLNRAADNWQFNGRKMFSDEENQERKQIWWGCCIADNSKFAWWITDIAPPGRPTCIGENDFDTLLPDAEEDDSHLSHQLNVMSHQSLSIVFVMRCFRAASSLSVIIGLIVSSVYPVKSSKHGSRRAILNDLEARLDQWYLELPTDLRYDPASKRNTPPAPVLYIHIKYWSAVLLLHRAFIPNWKGSESILQNPPSGSNTTSLKAFDLCQSAATYISTIVTTYHDCYNIKRASPFFFTIYPHIMHIVTLTIRPSNMQAYIGLQQLLTALTNMQTTWPSAARAWDLLHGVKVQVDSNLTPMLQGPDRQKRGADDAFGREKSSDFLQREAFGDSGSRERMTSTPGIQDISTRMMAHMLGLDIPGIEPSTSYYPGYEWWPRATNTMQAPYQQPSPSAQSSESQINTNYPAAQGDPGWRVPSTGYSYGFHGSSNNYRM